jgi:hypothetical protein
MNLHAAQRAFRSALLEGAETILAEIVDGPPITPRRRLAIYGDGYFSRLTDALQANYPKLHFVLGDEVFASLGRGFIRAHPSSTPSIRWFGRALPEYLAGTEPYASQPVLSELARFEWLLGEAFDAADAPPLDRSALAAIAPAAWAQASFRFHPSVRRARFDWNAAAIWHAADAEETVPQPQRFAQTAQWIIWRQNFRNYFRSLDPCETLMIDCAMSGLPFGEICESLAGTMPEVEVPLYAATQVATWADGGMLIGG